MIWLNVLTCRSHIFQHLCSNCRNHNISLVSQNAICPCHQQHEGFHICSGICLPFTSIRDHPHYLCSLNGFFSFFLCSKLQNLVCITSFFYITNGIAWCFFFTYDLNGSLEVLLFLFIYYYTFYLCRHNFRNQITGRIRYNSAKYLSQVIHQNKTQINRILITWNCYNFPKRHQRIIVENIFLKGNLGSFMT